MFDEQPDGDPHGECDAEIRRLSRELDEAKRLLRDAAEQVPVGYQRLVDGKWEHCSAFLAYGLNDQMFPGFRAVYAAPVPSSPSIEREVSGEASAEDAAPTGGLDLADVPVPRENSWQRPSKEWYAEKIADTQQAEDAAGGVLAAGALTNPPRHKFWGAGEPACPPELKAPNGELHTMRCKVCGEGWRKSRDVCLAALAVTPCDGGKNG